MAEKCIIPLQLEAKTVKGLRADYSMSIVNIGVHGEICLKQMGKKIDKLDLTRDGK